MKPFQDISRTTHVITGASTGPGVGEWAPAGESRVIVSAFSLSLTRSVGKTDGMDTSEIDRYRQGINVTNLDYFFESPLFKITGNKFLDTSEIDQDELHAVEIRDFGQSRLFETNKPFKDLVGLVNPVDFINDKGTQEYPQVYFDVALKNPDQMDGVIEAFSIRESISNTSIEGPYTAHGIYASSMAGNIENIEGTDTISQTIPLTASLQVDPFIDGESVIMSNTGSQVDAAMLSVPAVNGTDFSLAAPGITSDITRILSPFDDARLPTRMRLPELSDRSGSNTASHGLVDLTGSFNERGLIDYLQKSSAAGYEYQNNVEYGTDSIAFGGLKR